MSKIKIVFSIILISILGVFMMISTTTFEPSFDVSKLFSLTTLQIDASVKSFGSNLVV